MYPAIYNSKKTSGPLWDEWVAHVKQHEQLWEDYAKEDPHGFQHFTEHEEVLRAARGY
jgi:hypothetical protein